MAILLRTKMRTFHESNEGTCQDSRGCQHEELVYIWLHLLHCRWSLRPGLLVKEEYVEKIGSWLLYFIRCSDLYAKHPSKCKAQSYPCLPRKEESNKWTHYRVVQGITVCSLGILVSAKAPFCDELCNPKQRKADIHQVERTLEERSTRYTI